MSLSKEHLELLHLYVSSGIDVFFEKTAQNRMQSLASPDGHKVSCAVSAVSQTHISQKKSDVDHIAKFSDLCHAIKVFDGCALKKTAINTVIYDGQTDAKIMLIGEAPGANEDEQGIPFCGASGKLLDNILHSISLSRKSNVFITNTVFWRPPGNRRPIPEEIMSCKPFLEKMIALIRPRFIILVGSTAVESLLNIRAVSMSELRKKDFAYTNKHLNNQSIPTKVILHPAYLLRQPAQKKVMWFDILTIKNLLQSVQS